MRGLIDAAQLGNVTLANAPGTGVADDKSVYVYVPDMIRYYLGQEPLLQNVETYLCRRPDDLEYTLDNMADLVVKRVGESGGYGMIIGPHATQEERDDYARVLRADPVGFIAQPVLALSRSPCLIDDRFEPRHVDLRPFLLTGRCTRIVPGAFCRVSPCGGAAWWSIPARAAAAKTSGCWKTQNTQRKLPHHNPPVHNLPVEG